MDAEDFLEDKRDRLADGLFFTTPANRLLLP